MHAKTQTILIQVHPIAFVKVTEYLKKKDIPTKEIHLNNFLIISQQVALHHIYNVFKPLANDSHSNQTLDMIQAMAFDQSSI